MSPYIHFVRGSAPATEYNGFTEITQSAEFFATDWRVGWSFTVGASDLTLVGLRVWVPDAVAQRVKVHRVSDAVQMATLDIVGSPSAWADGTLGSSVTLAASVQYCVSTKEVGGSVNQHRNPTSHAFQSHFTWVDSRVGGDAEAMPTSVQATNKYFNSDIRYTV